MQLVWVSLCCTFSLQEPIAEVSERSPFPSPPPDCSDKLLPLYHDMCQDLDLNCSAMTAQLQQILRMANGPGISNHLFILHGIAVQFSYLPLSAIGIFLGVFKFSSFGVLIILCLHSVYFYVALSVNGSLLVEPASLWFGFLSDLLTGLVPGATWDCCEVFRLLTPVNWVKEPCKLMCDLVIGFGCWPLGRSNN